jgi:hypothetical protein
MQVLQEEAVKHISASAKKVFNQVKSTKSGNVKVGDDVHIPLVPQDCAKISSGNLTEVVVNIKLFRDWVTIRC